MDANEFKTKVKESLAKISNMSESDIEEKYSKTMESEIFHELSRKLDPKWVCELKDCEVCKAETSDAGLQQVQEDT